MVEAMCHHGEGARKVDEGHHWVLEVSYNLLELINNSQEVEESHQVDEQPLTQLEQY